jgi:two-component system, LytTR family, response regulator
MTGKDLRVVIADDERPAREFLKRVLGPIGGAIVLGEAGSGPELVGLIRKTKPDLAFVDLQMPEMSGIQAVKAIGPDEMPLVCFVTAFDHYAVEAFELNAVDYLLKPVEIERLALSLERARKRMEADKWRDSESGRLASAIEIIERTGKRLERVPVRIGDDIVFVPAGDIVSVAAGGELLHIATLNGRRYTINYRLKDLAARLDPEKFIRLSRGSLVNLEMMEKVSVAPGGTYIVTLRNGQKLSTSRSQSKTLRERLLKL